MIKFNLVTFISLIFLTSCAHVHHDVDRVPSNEANSCSEIIKSFYLTDDYQIKLEKSLVDKKLISRGSKFITVNHPRLEWLNTVRDSLTTKIKNWNTNRYPAFYIFHDSEIIERAKKFSAAIVKQSSKNKLSVAEREHVSYINSIVAKYKSYDSEINHLLDERIILEYNLNIIKKLKIRKDETRNITLTFLKDGKKVDRNFALSAKDNDLEFLKKSLKADIDSFDGTFIKNGKIKDRVISQAALRDMIEIAKKELEHAIVNSPKISDVATRQLDLLTQTLADSAISPKTYGVYRVTNAVFLREVAALSKLDIVYKKFLETPTLKVKEIFSNYLKSKESKKSAEEKIGIFKKTYAKVTKITPKQALIAGASVTAIGVGTTSFFTIKEPVVTEIIPTDQEINHPEIEFDATEEIIKEESYVYTGTINDIIEDLVMQ